MAFGLFELQLSNPNIAIVRSSGLNAQSHLSQLSCSTPVVGLLLTSIFVVYFALFKATTFKGNCLCFACRLLLLLFYVPLLFFCGAYIDGCIVFCTIFCRLLYTGYFAYRYKSMLFLLLNAPVLAFVEGKGWYYDYNPFVVLSGGEHFVNFGIHMVPFASGKDLYVAIRGRRDEDLYLMRCVELINGSFFYIFASEPVVGVVNLRFTEIQLYEDVVSSH